MAGGHPTYPSRTIPVSDERASARHGAVLGPAARQVSAFLLALCAAAVVLATWPSPTSRPDPATGIDGRVPAPTEPSGDAAPVVTPPEIVMRVGVKFRPPSETALFEALLSSDADLDLDRIAVAVESAESSRGT